MKRLIKLAVLGGLAYLGWEYAQRMRAEAEDPGKLEPSSVYTPPPPAAPAPARVEAVQEPEAGEPAASIEPAASSSSGAPAAKASKAELYELAKELGIKGRSKMSRAELERAIHDAS